jgi:hypothetical protein
MPRFSFAESLFGAERGGGGGAASERRIAAAKRRARTTWDRITKNIIEISLLRSKRDGKSQGEEGSKGQIGISERGKAQRREPK